MKLAAHLGEGQVLGDDLLEEIVSRSDGVPLFLEELTQAVLESTSEGVVGKVPPSRSAIPATLYASLTARLDRLGSAKDLAQIGAVVGREFSYELVRDLCPLNEEQLDSALHRLASSGLVLQRGAPPAATYQFKHALVQQAAYEMLLYSDRRRLHARLASVLENLPEMAALQPEVLAQHLAAADLHENAVEYWIKAGARSVARSAMQEAEAQFEKALAELAYLPETRERQRKELLLQADLGAIRFAVRGWASAETGQSYARARELWEQLGCPSDCLNVPWGQWMYHTNRGDFDLGRCMAEDWLDRSQKRADLRSLVLAHLSLGGTLLMKGEFESARLHLRDVNRLLVPDDAPLFIRLSGIHVHAMSLTFLGLADFCLGYPDQALLSTDSATSVARVQQHSPSISQSLSMMARLQYLIGDAGQLAECAETLLAIAASQGFPHWRGLGLIFSGWVKSAAGEIDNGISSIREGIGAYCRTGAQAWTPLFYALEAEAEALRGHVEAALGILDHALQTARALHETWFEAELVRRRGELLRDRDQQSAEALSREALEIARRQEAKLWELRAAASLARLWAAAGRVPAARNLIAPVYGWFTEGFGTPDLKEAKVLLEELG
jgi:predicted ATPase